MRQPQVLGGTLIATGFLNLVEIVTGARLAAILWPILLIIAAVQLLTDREPEGAYEGEAKHGVRTGH